MLGNSIACYYLVSFPLDPTLAREHHTMHSSPESTRAHCSHTDTHTPTHPPRYEQHATQLYRYITSAMPMSAERPAHPRPLHDPPQPLQPPSPETRAVEPVSTRRRLARRYICRIGNPLSLFRRRHRMRSYDAIRTA